MSNPIRRSYASGFPRNYPTNDEQHERDKNYRNQTTKYPRHPVSSAQPINVRPQMNFYNRPYTAQNKLAGQSPYSLGVRHTPMWSAPVHPIELYRREDFLRTAPSVMSNTFSETSRSTYSLPAKYALSPGWSRASNLTHNNVASNDEKVSETSMLSTENDTKKCVQRNWEYTTLGGLIGSNHDSSTIGDGTRLMLMSYNILAPSLLEDHRYLYKDCENSVLDLSFRVLKFFNEIEEFQPDIICLQEMESSYYYDTYNPEFQLRGYKGVYKKRTHDKLDGCAIFYKTNKLSLVEKLGVEYNQPHVPLLDRDNIGLIVKLQSKLGRRLKFIVGTTHLLYNPKRVDVKLAQAQLLLAELDRFSFSGFDNKGQPTYYPIIVTGDFNSEPYNPIVRLVTDGQLFYSGDSETKSKFMAKKGLEDFLPNYFGVSDQCQHYRIVLERLQRWKSHRKNNFELDLKDHDNLVNLCTAAKGLPCDNIQHIESVTKKSDLQPPNLSSELYKDRTVFRSTNFSEDIDVNTMDMCFSQNPSVVPSKPNLTINSSHLPSVLTIQLDQKLHTYVLNEIYKAGTVCTFGSGELSHKLSLRSVYSPKLDRMKNTENVATTKQNGWVCVDYIFYSMLWNDRLNKKTEGKLKLIRRLGLLSRNECKEMGTMPNTSVPSDHFPLVAEFLLNQ